MDSSGTTGREPRSDPGRFTEADLVDRVQAGDDEAFELLLRRHRSQLSGQIRRDLPDAIRRKISVADVLQEASLTAYRRLPDFEYRGEGSVLAWLRKIAELKVRHAVQRYATTAKRAAGREVTRGGRPDTANFAGQGPSPSEDAVATERAERTRRTMAKLREVDRTVLRLAIEQQLPLREVAKRMGRSREAAKKLYGRALARFTKLFRQDGGREP
jgi:RNA polymerase sigma-70 factor (ECF subfamily)